MAVDTSAVQIVINVVDGNSGEVVAKVSQSLGQLGAAGATTGSRMKQGMDEAGTGAQTAREKVHLLTEEFGIRLPRAFRGIIAESKLAQAALNAVGTGLIAFGAIQIGVMVFTQIYEGVKKIYEKWFDVDGAIEKYNSLASEAASKKFYENAGIDELNADLKEANAQLNELNQKKELATNKNASWSQFGSMLKSSLTSIGTAGMIPYKYHFSVEDAGHLNDSQGQSDSDREKLLEKNHKEAIQKIQDASLVAQARVQGIAKERLARKEADDVAGANRKYQIKQQNLLHEITSRPQTAKPGEKGYVKPVEAAGTNAYKTEEDLAKQHAQAEFEAKQTETQREHTLELRHLHEEALESGLRGSRLYAAQEAYAIESLKEKQIYSSQSVNDVRQKFHNEEMKRLEDIQLETAKIERQAEAVGMTGIAKLQIEGTGRVQDLNDDKRLDDYPAERAKRVAAATRETNAEIAVDQKSFSEELDQIVEDSQGRQLSGFARIEAEANKARASWQKHYDTLTNGMDVSTPGGQAQLDKATGEYGHGLDAIDQGAKRQSAELSRHNSDETAQLEAEARAKWLSAEKQQSAAIETEYEERLRKYKEQLDNKEIFDNDYNRRVLAAEQLKNAQLVEASKAAREKMAGEFSRFFKDPMGSLKEMGDKAAGEAAAAMVQRAQNHFGGAGASASAPGGEGGMFGGLFDRIAGAPKNGAAGAAAKAGTVMPGAVAASKLSVGTAQISIGSANVTFGAGGAPGAMGLSSGSRDAGSSIGFSAPSGAATVSSTFGGGGVAPGAMGLPSGSRDAGSPLSFNAPSGTGTESRTLSSSSTGAAGGYGTSGSTVGGAGDPGSVGTMPVGFAGTPGSAPAPSNTLGTALGNVQKAHSFGKQVKNIFGHKKSGSDNGVASYEHDALPGKLNADGSFTSASSESKMSRVEGAAQGAMGLYSAYEGNGGVGGALSGAMSGAQLGNSLAGPWGAAVGAAAGTVLGAIGFGGREKARVYDLKQVRPQIANDTSSYQQGSMDYLTAYSDMQSLDSEAKKTTNSYGPAARSYYQDTIKKEIHQAEAKFTSQQKAGRSQFTATGAQGHQGGWTGEFGSMSTGSDTGWVHTRAKEFIVNEQPAADHAGALEAIRAGATHSDMAKYYGGDSGTMPAQTQSAGDVHLHLSAIDGKSSMQFLSANKHNIRKVLNESYGENSGGADA
jgi:hypothetical protein